MLVKMPNLVIRLADKTPISWAFLGPDGSLISLHCEVRWSAGSAPMVADAYVGALSKTRPSQGIGREAHASRAW